MTNSDDDLMPVELLRGFLEQLREGTGLDDHPFVARVSVLPEFRDPDAAAGQTGRLGEQTAVALRAVWRQFKPPALSLDYRREWNFFLIMEVMYFFPFTRHKPFPETLKHAAALLCDQEYLAQIIADAEPEQAGPLAGDSRAFWDGLIPAAMTPAEQTIHSRRNAALGKLARALGRKLAAVAPQAPQPAARVAVMAVPDAVKTVWPGAELGHGPEIEKQSNRLVDAFVIATKLNEADELRVPLRSAWPIRRDTVADDVRSQARAVLERVAGAGARVKPGQLDELALWLWPLGFPQSFGVKRPQTGGVWWWDSLYRQRQLVACFEQTNDDQMRLQCAAALRQSSLAETVKDNAGLAALFYDRWIPALEAIAQEALNTKSGTGQHAVAVAILAKNEFALRLMGGDDTYWVLLPEIVALLSVGNPSS